jgi:hypothetical protein
VPPISTTAILPDNTDPSTVQDQALSTQPAVASEGAPDTQQTENPQDFDNLSLEEMTALWEQQEAQAALPPQPSVSENGTPEGNTSTAPESHEAGTAAELEGERLAKNFRLRANSDTDALAMTLMARNPGMGLAEALAKVSPAATHAAPAETPEAEPATRSSASYDAIVSRQSELNAELRAAHEAMDFELAGQLQVEALSLIEQKMQAQAQQAIAAAQQAQDVESQWQDYEAQTAALYPQAAYDNSPFRQKMLEIHGALKGAGDPLLNSPESTLRIAQMAAAQLAIAPATVQATNAPKAAQSPPPAPVRPRPMAGGSSHGLALPANTAALEQQLAAFTPDQWADFNQNYK